MKFRSLFDVVGDAKDVVAFFDNVESVEQMISKLERVKRGESEDFLICVQSLKISIEAAMDDTLEMGGSGDIDDEETELNDEEISELENETEDETPPETEAPGVVKT